MKTKTFVLVVLIVAMTLTSCGTSFLPEKHKSKEEIITIFKDNKDLFVDVVGDLFEFKYPWAIDNNQGDGASYWKCVDLDAGMELVILDDEYFKQMPFLLKSVENNKSICPIIKGLKFEYISSEAFVDSGCIYFIKQTGINYESGILYCPSGVSENQYMTKMELIEDSWYYYESK